MKSAFILFTLFFSTATVWAQRTPMQTSAAQIRVLTTALENDLRFQFISVSKIIILGNTAKVEYMDSTGLCTSVSYNTSTDAMGEPQVQLDPHASTACEPKFARINPNTGKPIFTPIQ